MALSVTVTLAVARHLMPVAYGRLSFWLALVSLVAPLMSLGLNSLISREVLQRSGDSQSILGSALVLRIVAGLLVAVFASQAAYWFLSPDDAGLLTLLLFASVANAALVIDFWLQARLANRQAASIRLAVLLPFSLTRLTAVAFDADITIFVYLLAAEYLVIGACYIGIYQRITGAVEGLRISSAECHRLLGDSRWLLLSGIAAVIYLKVDQVMLGLLVGEREVGIYAVAAKFCEVWYFLPAIIVTVYFPHLIILRGNDPSRYASDLQKLNDALFIMAVSLAMLVTLIASSLVPWLFGEAYADSVPVILVHVWASVLVFMRSLLSKWLIIENLLRLSLLSQISGAVVNICLNAYLIPRYGALGAAYATVISYLIAGYLVLFMHADLKPMAVIVSRSFFLPFRLIQHGRRLYSHDTR